MTRIRTLGEITAPVLICGGAFGNLEALTALAGQAAALAIPPEHIIHTGDMVAYCADGAACASFIRDAGWLAIKGNVEEQLGAGAADCGCGFEATSTCAAASEVWYRHALATLSRDQCEWMNRLPAALTFTMGGKSFHVVHGSSRQTNRFMFASLPAAEFAAEFAATGADAIIAGHTGLPFTRLIGNRLWHNAGALGMPANDGTPRVWFSVLSPHARTIRISHYALGYDHAAAAARLRAAGLPEGYASGLETGLWPSLDILPEAERAATGQALEASDVSWPRPEVLAAE